MHRRMNSMYTIVYHSSIVRLFAMNNKKVATYNIPPTNWYLLAAAALPYKLTSMLATTNTKAENVSTAFIMEPKVQYFIETTKSFFSHTYTQMCTSYRV